jgi:predicted nucleotide-binding protein
MANDPLRAALLKKYSERHIVRLVTARANEQFLTRRLAMVSVARDAGINVAKYATDDEMATLRGHDRAKKAEASAAPAAATPVATPRRRTPPVRRPAEHRAARGPRDKVFVVHGRDSTIRDSMFAFLRSVDLNPIEWGQAMSATGEAMPSIPATLGAALAGGVSAVVVVLTPDDLVVLKERLWKKSDPDEEKRQMGQARPNVLFEGGMAFALHPDKTVIVSLGRVKSFTDVSGLHIIRLNNTAAKRSELVEALRRAGADVQTDGRTDWYRVGEFEVKEDDDGNK